MVISYFGTDMRRTRQQKIIASLRKQIPGTISVDRQAESTPKRESYYAPEIVLPMNDIKKDLRRVLLILVLTLVIQGGLYTYLQVAGWGLIRSFGAF
jgi:hypothetical protein